jgi:hypothetical protein
VQDPHGHDLDPAQRKGSGNPVQRDLRDATARRGPDVEDIREGPLQVRDRRCVRKCRNDLTLDHVVSADLVQSEHMIGVAMRKQDGVYAAYVVCQRLGAQIGGRIHQDRADGAGDRRLAISFMPRQFDEDRGTTAPVFRVGGAAHAAVAADHRHAMRRAGAEEGDLKAQ